MNLTGQKLIPILFGNFKSNILYGNVLNSYS